MIATNPSRAPSNVDGIFSAWRESRLSNISDLYVNFFMLRAASEKVWPSMGSLF